VLRWMEAVRGASPALVDGSPQVEPVAFVPFFERDTGGGYCTIDLSAFNWNRRRKAAHKLDPFGKTRAGVPVKRVSGADVLTELRGAVRDRDNQIAVIAHRTLRTKLESNREGAGETFVRWLQQATRAGLENRNMSVHPADAERKRLLEQFVSTPIERFFAAENPATIPWLVGIRCLNRDTGSIRKVNVPRRIDGNLTAQWYQSEAVVKLLYVGYRWADGKIDRQRPILFAVGQADELSRQKSGKWVPVEAPPESPLRGRPLGSDGNFKSFRREWEQAFGELCRSEGIVKLFTVAQGCVLEKMDGTRFQLRNFDKSEPWMTAAAFKNIRRVYRSPLRVM
jgi:hypothetical protein